MAVAESLSASRFATVLPTAPRASVEWSPFAVHIVEAPAYFAGTFTDHVLTLEEFGAFRAGQAIDGRWSEGWCRPGSVGLVPAHRRTTWETTRSSATVTGDFAVYSGCIPLAGHDAGLGC